MAAALARSRSLPANPIGTALVVALAIYCIASATQDIAIDGYTIGLVDRGARGPANAVRTTAYRVGLTRSGSGLPAAARSDRLARDVPRRRRAHASRSRPRSRLTPPIALPPPAERRPLRRAARWLVRPGVGAGASRS